MASLFLLVVSLTTILYTSRADLISDVCSQSTNPAKCNKALRSDPSSAGSDLRGLGQIALHEALEAARDTIKVAKLLGDDGRAETCVETCGDAIDNLNDCKSLLKARDRFSISTLQTRASAALSDVVTCNDEYEESHEPHRLKKATQATQLLIDVLLVIANRL